MQCIIGFLLVGLHYLECNRVLFSIGLLQILESSPEGSNTATE
jgi:hypothetical protein